MSQVCETATVVRKDHPDGKVDINKSDMTKDDVLWPDKPEPAGSKTVKSGEKAKTKPAE